MRLSIINFAGIARTDVAVGTVSDASILCTTRAATPRMVSTVDALGVTNVGIGFTTGSAGVGVAAALTAGVFGMCWFMAGVTVSFTGAGDDTGGITGDDTGETFWAVTGTTGTSPDFTAALGSGGVPPLGASDNVGRPGVKDFDARGA